MNRRWVALVGAAATVASTLAVGVAVPASAAPCDPGGNAIVCENSKAGTPQSVWDISGAGDQGLQGFATQFSVNVGQTEQFKIKTTASSYTVDIYRLGWYGGNGARKIASVTPTARNQPTCLTDPSTNLVDCGNWAVSASWAVPSDAVSGVYIAHLKNAANNDESHIPFVVRNDSSHSDVVFQTSDSTWQAYNYYGGANFYSADAGLANGRALKLSYNRPFATRGDWDGRDFLFSNEFPMLQFLERNGYDVSYMGSYDADVRGSLIRNHKTFLSVGHDEYWSGAQRANVEAARDAGVNLAFFSGNEVYWRTRWEGSVDGTSTDGRTLVCYKETWADGKIDPAPEWTGTWRDPRYAPPSTGAGKAENALTGTLFMSNSSDLPITVSEREGKLRLWRSTALSGMSPGQSTALAAHTVGYESDEDVDNGQRPAGLITMSTTTGPSASYLQDYGTLVAPGTTTHHLTLYRASSGALIFGAGTVQWAWGLSQNHDGVGAAADSRIQQATLNILADMDALPSTLMSGLTAPTKSTDTTGPTATVTSPPSGAALANGASVTVTGTATDTGGGRVAGVEVSLDGGNTWRPATGQTSWTYTGYITGRGASAIKVRAVDDSANIGAVTDRPVTVSCPCSLFGQQLPAVPSTTDANAVELGVRWVPSETGYVNGIRFYKGTGNTGTHTGSLWTSSGGLLATGTFSNETSSGWQTLTFPEAVAVDAGTTYIASYYAPNGRYAVTSNFFYGGDHVAAPLTAKGRNSNESNGVYSVGAGFPTSSYSATNYWVDVLYTVDDTTPPIVTSTSPFPNSSSVTPVAKPRVTFSRAIDPSSLSFTLKEADNTAVSGTTSYDSATRAATFTPSADLTRGVTYTATVQASSSYGVPMASPSTWSFTTALNDPLPGSCPCSIWTDSATPAIETVASTTSVELGVKFTAEVPGEIAGIKFYKGPQNLGTHVGSLWTSAGTLLSSVTFTGESGGGWQTAQFSSPVAISANTTYVVSYRAPVGGYSATIGGLSAPVDNAPLHTLATGGVYTYGTGYPTSSSEANYWVDVVFLAADVAPTVGSVTPGDGSTSVPVTSKASAQLVGMVQPGSAQITLKNSSGTVVPGTPTYSAATKTITYTPAEALPSGQTFTATVSGATALSGQQMTPYSWSFTTAGVTACPCTLFESSATPAVLDPGDTNAISLGVRFVPSVAGYVTGVRFYKAAANTGTHTGSLWSSDGTRLATVTFAGESATGWQTATFTQPVQLTAGQAYVVSYFTPNGHYSASAGFFTSLWDNTVLAAAPGSNGLYAYGSDTLPTGSYNSTNYWVDAIFTPGAAPDVTPPTVTDRSPIAGATSVGTGSPVTVNFSEPIDSATLALTLKDGATTVPSSVGYDAASRTATLSPTSALAGGTTYTVTVAVKDPAGNALAATTWTFRTAQAAPPGVCPCSVWDDTATPSIVTVADPRTVELGMKFSSDTAGYITGVRFYKGPQNTGTHTGSLWSTDGTRLATGTFSNETTSGWQTLIFPSSVTVAPGTTYIVSYLTSGYYSANTGGVAAIDNPPLHTPTDPALYLYGGGYPTGASSANYWVDPVFDVVPGTPPADTTAPVVTSVAASPGTDGSTATVTWTTDESATSVVQYGTTTALGSSSAAGTGTSHSVALSGLSDGTAYYYRVVSTDAAGNSTTDPVAGSEPRTFATPDTTAPAVSNVAAVPSGTSVTVTWTTNETASTSLSYGPTASLGSTATGAAGTTHSVGLSGLAPGTYYYRVVSADAALNSTTDPVTSSAPRTFVIADTAPPVITAVASSGSGTTATITWTTDESSTSSVSYGTTTALGTTRTSTSGTSHTVSLTGLTANTRYYFRVTSADAASNSATSPAAPAAPASYLPTVAPIAHTTVAQFSTGTGGYVSDTSGGEVLSTLTVGSEFTGTTTPTGFTSAALVSGGATTYSGGQASLSGSRLYTGTYATGRSFASAATLGVNHTIGWGSIAVGSTTVTASFQTSASGALSARINDGGANNRTIAIAGTWTGVEHEYRVDWSGGNAVFFVDGTEVARSAFSTGLSLRFVASDPTTASPVLAVDWTRVAPYAASATFVSAVIDAGATVGWDTLTRDVVLPSGTTLTIQVRSGPNANSGSGAWTGWTTVSATTNSITRSSRYLQYQLQFTTTGTRFVSPTVRGVSLGFHVL